MKQLAIMKSISRSLVRVKFQAVKHAPEILIGAGIVGGITSTVLACIATTKVESVIEKAKDEIDDIHAEATAYSEGLLELEKAPETKKSLAIVYAKTGVEFVKLYGPSVALGALSITGMVSSTRILKKRNTALAAAYVTIDKSFKEYRKRVSERFGENIEKEIRYNTTQSPFEEKVINEKGKEKTVTVMKPVTDLSAYSDFAMYFDTTTSYDAHDNTDYDYNLVLLRGRQSMSNMRLQCSETGYLFLISVLEDIGAKLTPELAKAAQVVGWKYDKNNPIGDNCVDYRIQEVYRLNEDNEYEKAIILDFNVDGNVWEMMAAK